MLTDSFVQTADDSRPRDRAIVTLLLYTALRLNELVSLDLDDVSISARKGLLVVKSGKGDLYREVPLNSSCRHALTDWLHDRTAADGEQALFTGPQGRRLSARAVDLVVRNVAARAEIKLSAHTLRHYVDGWVMWPAGLFPLLGLAPGPVPAT